MMQERPWQTSVLVYFFCPTADFVGCPEAASFTSAVAALAAAKLGAQAGMPSLEEGEWFINRG